MADEIVEGKRPQRARLSDVGERDRLDYPVYQDSRRPPDSVSINPEDGMPQQLPASSMEDNLAPALAVETFVCMADKSKFVKRDEKGYVVEEFDPSKVERSPDGRYWVVTRYICPNGVERSLWREVTPIRPQCDHYVRQLLPWADDTDHKLCTRYCAALKNEQGELFSLDNQQVLACEMRSPRVASDDEKIDEFDQLIILKGKSRADEEFDVDAALRNEGMGLGVLGGNK